MRQLVTIAVVSTLCLSGCAGIKETNQKFADVDAKIGSLEDQHQTDVSALENRNRELEARQSAMEARYSQDVAKLDKTVREALDRANAAHKLAEGKFVMSTVLTDESVKFKADQITLSEEAKAYLTEFAASLLDDNKNVYLEIQGHTDSIGSDMANHALGMRRADAVRAFLHQQGVPLNRMNTVSYGESVPLDTNKTAAGRAANRRVVIVVLN